MNDLKNIELLAPARDYECGIAAINYGADAVYIGAPKFGARAAVGNSLGDIYKLTEYAHKYYARVYVTLNTIIYENEILEVQNLIHSIYNIGVDALIIQDLGILKMDIPSIPLFASTQTDNYDLSRIKFLKDAGLQRIILARELSLNQIEQIHHEVDVELEAFIHGALCVCYSGNCYLSQEITGRSANRGECSQPCRSKYTLEDKDGKIIAKDKYLLSLKDLNLSNRISDLLDAGISSFKIEGRLKDIDYVKNVTAFYRQKIDEILEGRINFQKSSSGKITFDFNPDLNKSFNRGYSEYFVDKRQDSLTTMNTQKALGEFIGKVTDVYSNYFKIKSQIELNNADGLCFFDDLGELTGVNVNRVEDGKIYPANMKSIKKGLLIYRNYEKKFKDILSNNKTSRKISVKIFIKEVNAKLLFEIVDESNNLFNYYIEDFIFADNQDKAKEQLKKQLSKSGETIYSISEVELELNTVPFLPVSRINEIRRILLNGLDALRIINYPKLNKTYSSAHNSSLNKKKLDYTYNVVNTLSKFFYKNLGVENIEEGFELQKHNTCKTLMRTKYCVKREFDICPIDQKDKNLYGSMILKENNKKYLLEFDCKNCEMLLKKI